MAIYDEKYRSFKGEVGGRFSRIWTIFTAEFVFRMKNPWNIALLGVTLFFGLFPTIFMRNPFLFLVWSFIWSIIFTSVAGGDLLSSDRKFNTVTLYFSRPLEKIDYFLGKVATSFTLMGLVTFIPCLIMSLVVYGTFKGDAELVSGISFDVDRMAGAIIFMGIIWAILFGSISLMFSSFTKNRWYATAGIFAFIFFSELIGGLMAWLIHRDFGYVSITNDLAQLLVGLADVTTTASYYQWEVGLGYMVGLSIFSLLVSYLQIKRMDMSE